MPRIITVDPTGAIARIVRSAMDLLDLSITQVDVPSGAEALEELSRPANLIVSAYELDHNMKGFEFAIRVKGKAKETAVLILGDVDDPDDLDEETAAESPFVYMSRPVDIHMFLRVLMAGMESHEAMLEAMHQQEEVAAASTGNSMGPVPLIDLDMKAAQKILSDLDNELGAMAIIFANRDGEIVLEQGTTNSIDRESLTHALMPVMSTNIGVKDVVGGQISTVQLYDGDDYDIFVLSVGLHHFLSVIFDGQKGGRQFGMVLRFGRQAVENLIALLGANAFIVQAPIAEDKHEPAKRTRPAKKVEAEEPIVLERASLGDNGVLQAAPEPESVLPQFDAIPEGEFDLDKLFGGETNAEQKADELFDLDNLEKLAKDNQNDKGVDYDEAVRIGLIKG